MKYVIGMMLLTACGNAEFTQYPLLDVEQGCVTDRWGGEVVPVSDNEDCDDLLTNAVTPDGFCVILPNGCLPRGFESCDALTDCCAADVAPCRDF